MENKLVHVYKSVNMVEAAAAAAVVSIVCVSLALDD